jgi:hypothetical protein
MKLEPFGVDKRMAYLRTCHGGGTEFSRRSCSDPRKIAGKATIPFVERGLPTQVIIFGNLETKV